MANGYGSPVGVGARRSMTNAINDRGGASRRCPLPKLIKHAATSVTVAGGYAELGRGRRPRRPMTNGTLQSPTRLGRVPPCLRTAEDVGPYNVMVKPPFRRSPWRTVLFKGSLREAMIKSKIHRRGELCSPAKDRINSSFSGERRSPRR